MDAVMDMERDEIVKLGASLRSIDRNLLKKDSTIDRIWYQGGESYFDIFFDMKNNEIIWFQFTFRGKALYWDRHNPGIQTGTTTELELDDVVYYSASKLLKPDREKDFDFIELARSIIQTRSGEPIFAQALALFDANGTNDRA